jgi:hypothetical protein
MKPTRTSFFCFKRKKKSVILFFVFWGSYIQIKFIQSTLRKKTGRLANYKNEFPLFLREFFFS